MNSVLSGNGGQGGGTSGDTGGNAISGSNTGYGGGGGTQSAGGALGKGSGGVVQLVRHKWNSKFYALKVTDFACSKFIYPSPCAKCLLKIVNH